MDNKISRRDFAKRAGTIAAAGALASVAIPAVHAADSGTVNVALIGCGGRGTGAAGDAMGTKQGPVNVVAMADVFEDRLKSSYDRLKDRYGDRVDIGNRKYIGFEAYKEAIDQLKPGDVAILATPPAFRWVMFKYAIEKGINVFMEKPVTVDGPTTRRMIDLAAQADKKNMKVGVGLMCRHSKDRIELFKRIRDGAIGDIVLVRAYRQHGPVASAFSDPKPDNLTHTEYQIRRFHSFLWASGGCYSDFYIHNIDEGCWMADKWPVQASGSGGRHYRGNKVDQNFDTYNIEYTFDDGTKFYFGGRTMEGAEQKFATYVHGSKGLAIVSANGHAPSNARIYSGHKAERAKIVWSAGDNEPNPYQLEWDDLMEAIRKDKPYNEVKRGAEVSLVTSMGRFACHTGQPMTYEKMLNHDHEFAPNADKLTRDGEPPVKPLEDGKSYPVPQPGKLLNREY